MTDRALTSREDAFCTAYVADPKRNGTAAAIAAGYAPRSARVTASRLLTRANIRARISRLEAEAAEQARMTIGKVIERYSAIGARRSERPVLLRDLGLPLLPWKEPRLPVARTGRVPAGCRCVEGDA